MMTKTAEFIRDETYENRESPAEASFRQLYSLPVHLINVRRSFINIYCFFLSVGENDETLTIKCTSLFLFIIRVKYLC